MTRALRRLRTRAGTGERGVTLVEALMAMALMLVVLAIVASAFLGGSRLQSATSAETDGITDLRTTVERLGRDVRASRGIDASATASRLSMWIDINSDYDKQPATEVVTWELTPGSDGHFDVSRTVGGVSQRQSGLVISDLAFCYQEEADGPCMATPLTAASAALVKIVSGDIEYDANPDAGTEPRRTTFSESLRNVE